MKLKILFTAALLCAATAALAQNAPASIPAGGSPVDSASATYNAGQTSALGTAGSRDGTAYVEFKVRKSLKVELDDLKGGSTQSPDRGGGLTVSWDL